MRNDRLWALMSEVGVSTSRLAAEVGVDTKTVERWVSLGRLPHARYRAQVGGLLQCDPAVIWPEVVSVQPGLSGAAAVSELVAMYPARRDVPTGLWRSLMAGTRTEFALQAFAATFLPDQVMDMAAELVALAERGVRVRLLLGDPDGRSVDLRGVEEGGTGLAGRVRLVLGYIAPAVAHPQVQVRLHDHTLYASLFLFDDDLLVNPHVWGSPAGSNPLLHFRRQPQGRLTEPWLAGFERVWEQATPLDSWPRR